MLPTPKLESLVWTKYDFYSNANYPLQNRVAKNIFGRRHLTSNLQPAAAMLLFCKTVLLRIYMISCSHVKSIDWPKNFSGWVKVNLILYQSPLVCGLDCRRPLKWKSIWIEKMTLEGFEHMTSCSATILGEEMTLMFGGWVFIQIGVPLTFSYNLTLKWYNIWLFGFRNTKRWRNFIFTAVNEKFGWQVFISFIRFKAMVVDFSKKFTRSLLLVLYPNSWLPHPHH